MVLGNIRFRFHEKPGTVICNGCRGFDVTVDSDSQQFGIHKATKYLYFESNGAKETINGGAILMDQYVARHPRHDGQGYDNEYVYEVKIPAERFEAIKHSPALYGFEHELL